jgi:hypothetical protein
VVLVVVARVVRTTQPQHLAQRTLAVAVAVVVVLLETAVLAVQVS